MLLGGRVDWRALLTIVQPDTLVRWHRQAFRLLSRRKSRPRGRPPIPVELRRLIAETASANRTWGEGRIAAELLLKTRTDRVTAHGTPLHAFSYVASSDLDLLLRQLEMVHPFEHAM